MKKITQALNAQENRIYLSLFLVALLVSGAFWSGQYTYAFHMEGSNTSFQQWMGFTGLLFTCLFVGGVGCISLFIRSQTKQVRKSYYSEMKPMTLVHDMDLLAQNSGELILLLDQPRESSRETNTRIEPLRVSSNPGPLSGRRKTALLQPTRIPDAPFSKTETETEDLGEAGSLFPKKKFILRETERPWRRKGERPI